MKVITAECACLWLSVKFSTVTAKATTLISTEEDLLYFMIPISLGRQILQEPSEYLSLSFYRHPICQVAIFLSFFFFLFFPSAIVCAVLNKLPSFLDFYGVTYLVKVELRPNLVLNAEKELGIVAGLQGRVAPGAWRPCLHGNLWLNNFLVFWVICSLICGYLIS